VLKSISTDRLSAWASMELVWGVAGFMAAAGLISDHIGVSSQTQELDHVLEPHSKLNVGVFGSARDHTSLLHVLLGACKKEFNAERTAKSYEVSAWRLRRLWAKAKGIPEIGSEACEVPENMLELRAAKDTPSSALQGALPLLSPVPERRVVLWDLPAECAELMNLDRFDVLVTAYTRSVSKADEMMLAHLARSGARCFVVILVDFDGTGSEIEVQKQNFEALKKMRGQNFFPFLVCAERPDMYDMQRFLLSFSAAVFSRQGAHDFEACLLCRESVHQEEALFCEACGASYCCACAKTFFHQNDVDDPAKYAQLAGSVPVQCPGCLAVFSPSPWWLQWLRWLGSATAQNYL